MSALRYKFKSGVCRDTSLKGYSRSGKPYYHDCYRAEVYRNTAGGPVRLRKRFKSYIDALEWAARMRENGDFINSEN